MQLLRVKLCTSRDEQATSQGSVRELIHVHALFIESLAGLPGRNIISGADGDGASRIWSRRYISHARHQGKDDRAVHERHVCGARSWIACEESADLARGTADKRGIDSAVLGTLAEVCAGERVPGVLQPGSAKGIGWGSRAGLSAADAEGIGGGAGSALIAVTSDQ
jgi:hypothetical protein